jgi:hypothetical protein
MLQDYIVLVLRQPDAYDLYKDIYARKSSETKLQYLERCATLDFDDGDYQGAVYQEIYDKVTGAYK